MTAKEEEIRKYMKQERDHANELSNLQSQLDETRAEVKNLREKISSAEDNSEKSKELKKKIDLLQKSLSEKEAEILSMRNELDISKSEKLALESDKERAKTGIHTLLQKVQDSERWTKRIEEVLRKLEIISKEETLPEILDTIEERLQTMLKKGLPNLPTGSPHRRNIPQVGLKPPKRNPGRAGNNQQKINTISQSEEFVRTTEFIYRTHNSRTEVSASPKRFPLSQSQTFAELPSSFPETQLSSTIVPFSQVQNTFCSQVPFSPTGDLNELGNMLPSTPHEESTLEKEHNSATGKNKSDSQKATQHIADKTVTPSAHNKGKFKPDHYRRGSISTNDGEPRKSQDIGTTSESNPQRPKEVTNTGSKRKITAREVQSSLTSVESDAILDSQMTSQADTMTAGTSPKKTSSNTNQQPDAKGPIKGILKDPTTQNSLKRGVTTKAMDSWQNKRAKQSPKPIGASSKQTNASSEYFGNSASPTSSLASGSRRSNGNAGLQKHPAMTRSYGRGRRRSRGMSEIPR